MSRKCFFDFYFQNISKTKIIEGIFSCPSNVCMFQIRVSLCGIKSYSIAYTTYQNVGATRFNALGFHKSGPLGALIGADCGPHRPLSIVHCLWLWNGAGNDIEKYKHVFFLSRNSLDIFDTVIHRPAWYSNYHRPSRSSTLDDRLSDMDALYSLPPSSHDSQPLLSHGVPTGVMLPSARTEAVVQPASSEPVARRCWCHQWES